MRVCMCMRMREFSCACVRAYAYVTVYLDSNLICQIVITKFDICDKCQIYFDYKLI
jgi:hypothetical protein